MILKFKDYSPQEKIFSNIINNKRISAKDLKRTRIVFFAELTGGSVYRYIYTAYTARSIRPMKK